MDEVRVIRVVIDLDGSAFEAPSADASDGSVSPDGAATASGGDDSSGGGRSASKAQNKMRNFMKAQLIGYGKKVFGLAMDGINSYYNLEENYKASTGIENAKNAVTSVMSIVQAGRAGAAVAGWVGAAIGAGGAALAIPVRIGKSYISEAERLAELAYNKRYKSEALGLIDGSRGTEN